ncbi:MAG: hypothetical protein GY846_08590 [Deltaproteobacteria bacterium]|nr:hypothetical protein [Deltaproteobacteria bacterium]
MNGHVLHGEVPVESAVVTLYRAGPTRGSAAVALGTDQADSTGAFELSYFSPRDQYVVLYLTATGPSNAVKLASVVGVSPVPSDIVINERTTIATAYAMAQFIVGSDIGGTYPGLQNAAATLRNLVDLKSGDIGAVLAEFPNGSSTITLSEFNSLSNMLASCVETPGDCSSLFEETTTPDDLVPDNTLQAAVNIAHFPWWNVSALFQISQKFESYQPALQTAPEAWILAIRYEGNGRELDGPGNIAFDAEGNAWVCNNYTFSPDPFDPNVCGDNHLLKFTPSGENFPGAPYQGGGLYGAGFGITFDIHGNIWVGNFGFQGSGCNEDPKFLWNTVSKFSPEGMAISPDRDGNVSPGGYLSDEQARPQGTVSDREGNIWVANCKSTSVTKFEKGDHNQRVIYKNFGVEKPFDISIDPLGNAWVTSNGNHSVYVIDPDGNTRLVGDADVFQKPMGIAGDSQGNMWVSNSGGLAAPCEKETVQDIIDFLAGISHDAPVKGASVTMIKPDGTPSEGSPYTGGGLYMPWGIAVDGNDNVFVANFNGKRLSYLCGADPSNCPPGFNTGEPISGDGGYPFDGLTRNTGVQIDASGNVWLANNWEMVPVPTNPGGHQLVVFIGLAAPVKTPLIGPPERP